MANDRKLERMERVLRLKISSKLREPDVPVNAKMSVGITNAVCMKNWKLDSTEDSITIDMTTIWS